MESNTGSSGEISVELMQQILRDVDNDDSIVVQPGLVVNELNEELHGGSCLSRATVKYTRHGDTSEHSLSLMVKVVPNQISGADFVKESSLFIREIQMFDKILPRISELLAQALPDSHTDFSARKYFTRKTPSYLIVVEDLATKGFKAPKRNHGLDLRHCLLAFRTLARFHAASVVIRQENEGLFSVFNEDSFQEDGMREALNMLGSRFAQIITHAVESWPGFGPSWAERVRQRYKTIFEDLKQISRRDDDGFNVLNHNDFGIHNVMYRYSESSGDVEAMMLVDFQTCTYNSPVLDMHKFIFGSANDEVREKHINTLLTEYHTELTTTLEALGVPRGQTISLEQLQDDFESKMLYGFLYATRTLPFLNIDSDALLKFSLKDFLNPDVNIEQFYAFLTDSCATSLKQLLPFFSKKNIL